MLAPATAVHALLFKRDPKGAFGWIAVCLLAPVAGPILYVFFGLNRARSRASRIVPQALGANLERGELIADPPALPDHIADDYRPLAGIGQSLSRHKLLDGNRAEALINGEQAYPPMLRAIDSASNTIYLSTYILDAGDTGDAFVQALSTAARRGLQVCVLVDGFGDYYSLPRASRRLKRVGVQVRRFLPPRLFPPSLSINMRNHHKLLIVDNRLGFTGGMNIGDRHLVDDPNNRRPTRDLHFCLEGPVVSQLSAEFLRTWALAGGQPPKHELPPPQPAGDLWCRTITDGPDEDLDRLTMLLIAALAQARRSARIMTPYFLPTRELIGALQAAALRGIEVDVILPERNNLPYVHYATRNMLWEVLIRGIRVWYQPPPFNHGKLLIIDDEYCQIGSANWDPRSLRLNFELQVEIYGQQFAADIIDHFDRVRDSSRPVSLAEVDGRSLPARFRDACCWLFSPYL